jgi:hypothetical protein
MFELRLSVVEDHEITQVMHSPPGVSRGSSLNRFSFSMEDIQEYEDANMSGNLSIQDPVSYFADLPSGNRIAVDLQSTPRQSFDLEKSSDSF